MKSPKEKSLKVPFFVPNITTKDKIVIKKALNTPFLTDGPNLRKFEQNFGKFVGTKYATAVSNATAALFLSLKALGLKKNDEVIVPDMTFVATGSSILFAGGKPILADVNLSDMNISIDSIEKCVTKNTKAIIPVHFAGKSCSIDKIKKIAKEKNLHVIEDCAHAIGTKFKGKHVGTFGDTGCFSFYPTKNFTTIEGGMVITNHKTVSEYISTFRNHGITKTLSQRYSHGKPWEYDIIEPGHNYRLDEIRSVLGINQLKRIKSMNSLRRKVAKYYITELSKIDGIEVPEISTNEDNVYHLFIIKIKNKFGISRDKLHQKLLKKGIQTSVHYKPLHMFTVFQSSKKNEIKNSKKLYDEILSIPMFPTISKIQQEYVVKCIKKIHLES